MTDAPPKAVLELDPGVIRRAIDTAVVVTSEIVGFHLAALANADLSKPADALGLYRFNSASWTPQQRRVVHENWILAKAFQELLRAVRYGLEFAHVITTLVSMGPHRTKSDTTVADFLRPYGEQAQKLSFPDLLEQVNERLAIRLDFADAYQSLQAARNCLEHRDGIVGTHDLRGKEYFELSVPRMKIFYQRDGSEIEVAPGHIVDPGDGKAAAEI